MAGLTSDRMMRAPESPGQQRQAGDLVHGAEVGQSGSTELVAEQRRSAGDHDPDPAPQSEDHTERTADARQSHRRPPIDEIACPSPSK